MPSLHGRAGGDVIRTVRRGFRLGPDPLFLFRQWHSESLAVVFQLSELISVQIDPRTSGMPNALGFGSNTRSTVKQRPIYTTPDLVKERRIHIKRAY